MADEKDDNGAIAASDVTTEEAKATVDEVAEAKEEREDAISPEDGIEQLRRSIEEERRLREEEKARRVAAEQLAYQARIEAQNNDQRARAAQYHEVNSRLSFANERERALMSEWAEAKSMGDYQKEAEIQKALIQNSQDIQKLGQVKGHLENSLRQPAAPVEPPQMSDIDRWVGTLGPTEMQWYRARADKIQTKQDLLRIQAAHYRAVAEGIDVSTPEYFRFVDEDAGLVRRAARQDEDDDEALSSASRSAPRRAAPPPAAPVSRGGDRRGAATLSAAEREAAEISGISYEEYYRNQQKEKKRANAR